MRVKGTLNFSSEELEELRAQAKVDNRFNWKNKYEYLSLAVSVLCTFGLFSALMPGLYYQSASLRYPIYAFELFVSLYVNWIVTRKVFGRGGYIKCNKLWESVPFIKLIELTYRLEKVLPDIEHKNILMCKNNRVILLDACEDGGYMATNMIKFPSKALMYKVFTEEYIDIDFINSEVKRILTKEAYYYLKNESEERKGLA